jgi:hypothetical protein
MITNQYTTLVCRASIILLLLSSALQLNSQQVTNYSGLWKFDKSKSSEGELQSNYPGTVMRKISQTADTLSYTDTYRQPGSNDWETAPEKFCLDGKIQIRESSYSTNKKSVKWSADKNILTTIYEDTQVSKGVSKDFIMEDSYQLSADGKTLTVERHSKNPVQGEKTSKFVYQKD